MRNVPAAVPMPAKRAALAKAWDTRCRRGSDSVPLKEGLGHYWASSWQYSVVDGCSHVFPYRCAPSHVHLHLHPPMIRQSSAHVGMSRLPAAAKTRLVLRAVALNSALGRCTDPPRWHGLGGAQCWVTIRQPRSRSPDVGNGVIGKGWVASGVVSPRLAPGGPSSFPTARGRVKVPAERY